MELLVYTSRKNMLRLLHLCSLPDLIAIFLRPVCFISSVDPKQSFSVILDLEVAHLRSLTFAESTRRTYNCQLLNYLQFCGHLNIKPVPILPADLGRYIAYLSSSLCSLPFDSTLMRLGKCIWKQVIQIVY